jgi:superfamily II DNA or RNA helicase/predicted nucleotidyltransferase
MPSTLEDLTPGARVMGVIPEAGVEVVQVQWHGSAACTLTYRTQEGRTDQEVLYRSDEGRLAVETEERRWALDADPSLFRLASEALRIRLAYLFDPFLAVHTSNLEPLPHQITAVYEEMLTRQPLRFLLADDPGAGKTIMAGLLIKELIVRGDLTRCLVVAPGSLVEQWQEELWHKLGLEFDLVGRETIEASRSGNPYVERNLVISRLDHLARGDDVQAKLRQSEWDLVVVDEAHKMSAHYFGSEVKETKRFRLGRLLGDVTRHLLLMTATPHSGKDDDFQLFMSLLDADRFEGKSRGDAKAFDAQGMMRRIVKEKLLKFDGRPLFPDRRADTVSYALSDVERELYDAVTAYVRDEMNRAERLQAAGEGRRGTIVGFALTVLQRRLASSPEAILRSLERRRERLERRVLEEQSPRPSIEHGIALDDEDAIADLEELPDDELQELEEEVVDQASAAQTIAELRAEIETLGNLVTLARRVKSANRDRKWDELSKLLQDPELKVDSAGNPRKLIVFTEHRDTLNYLERRIGALRGSSANVAIHGGMRREDRRRAQELFIHDPEVTILVATDAAGEGVNLQRANLLVNYDLPWNPNRIEQRFGRIHRIGQTEVCHMWNLVAADTREGQVFDRLFEKLEEQRRALGGQVFDVLGQVFVEEPLRDLLIESIRDGDRPEVRARLDQVVDAAAGDNVRRALKERALVSDVLSPADVEHVKERMEEAEARRLQPHFIRSFFLEALRQAGGQIARREPGRYEVTHVPADIRGREATIGATRPILRRYERVTFDKELVNPGSGPPAELLAPGHPLLDAVVDVVLERHGALLERGTVLVSDGDEGEDARALIYLEDAIQSAATGEGGRRQVVSRRLQFIELPEDGELRLAGHAPYLDYRPAEPDEAALLSDLTAAPWLAGVEERGLDYAIQQALPAHLEEVRERTVERVTRTMAAVKERLTREIAYWDGRAEELKRQELAGRKPRLNSGRARQRADELETRLARRLEELEREKQLAPAPPVVRGGALVIPAGLIARLRGERATEPDLFARETKRVERAAVNAVLATERRLGRQPREMPQNNPGYDILSRDPITDQLLFIEVKGRVAGGQTVTVTKNEILTALNKPDDFVLALVRVDGDQTEVRYLERPFVQTEDALFGVTSINYTLSDLWGRAALPAPPKRPPIEHWVDLMVERLASQFAPERIVLFGSQVRGDGGPDSDVDLLVVMSQVDDKGAAIVDMHRALSGVPVAKDIFVTTPAEIERRGHLVGTVLKPALEEGRVVYARS